MRVRVRHHVNPLGVLFRERRLDRLVLPDGVPVEVEVGCADARFLFERAPHHPATLFVGLEIREPLVEQVNQQAREEGLTNLSACFAHVNIDLDQLFADGRLTRIHINFPDPWFKRRHHKRRLITEELAEVFFRKLEPGGELFFQSDIWDLALEAMAVFEESGLRNRLGPWSFERDNPFGARSLREVGCDNRGLRVWRMRYDRPA